MTRRQEIVTALILLAWIGGCAILFVKAREAMADEVAMARFEREFIPDLIQRDEIYEEARKRQREAFGFDEEGKL